MKPIVSRSTTHLDVGFLVAGHFDLASNLACGNLEHILCAGEPIIPSVLD